MIGSEQAAQQLGVSKQRVRTLCRQGRIAGAVLMGANWIIPDKFVVSAPKPRGNK